MRLLRTLLTALAVAVITVTSTAGCLSTDSTAKGGSLAKIATLKGATFTVGSKEFTEQLILCHITIFALRSVGAAVNEKCGLQGSNLARTVLTLGEIDMYWEYTGTAWINYLRHTDPINDPAKQYEAV